MKLIKYYGNGYTVSKSGEIFNKSGLSMSLKNDSKGFYKMVTLSSKGKKKTILVHRLVALAYIENKENKSQVNHKDGNKHNNNADNLEWVTASENMIHKYHVLGIKHNPPMLGKSGKDHNRSVGVSIKTPSGETENYGSYAEAEINTGIQISNFTLAKNKGLPYTFKRGKSKGFTVLSFNRINYVI